ncbi:class I SAM-dependent methyltransferase [Pedobacter sp. L105]|uniref:class I SAM-dependent methyltransferase n=1 Tax=Pedobacter sp. L105 TaxID=1641871 RepID=UPI00131C41CB|nr:class I SAM-dependent methyltransferase [Pedobacter sp. L105]
MFKTLKNIISKSAFFAAPTLKGSEEAYDLWSQNYDAQPGNLMLDMDEEIFSRLLRGINLKNKRVADIGCGTGRHWAKIFQRDPLTLTGFDVSAGMLNRLQEKFPKAYISKITDNLFSTTADAAYDVILSTLTVAHIENIEEALQSWSRILKKNGEIIITDFHPDALAFGGKRTFEHRKKQIEVQNYVHYIHDIEGILLKNNFHIVKREEKIVDEWVRHYYVSKNALPVYEKFKNSRIIYGIHLKRG